MGLNPEALAALESLRQQLVADGQPDERDEPAPEKAKESRPAKKKARVKKARAPKKITAVVEKPSADAKDQGTGEEVVQEPKRRQGKNGKTYPTPTQKRRARRKRVLERERLAAASGDAETADVEPAAPPTA